MIFEDLWVVQIEDKVEGLVIQRDLSGKRWRYVGCQG